MSGFGSTAGAVMERVSLRDSNLGSWLWKTAIIAMGGAAALGLQAVVPLPVPSLAANMPVFARPVVDGIAGTGYEQSVRVDTHGRVYTSVPNGGPSGTSWIWRSLDRGKTFKWVPNAAPLYGGIASCQGGGDTELATDTSDNLYYNILSLAQFSTARSADHGANFTPPNCISVTTVVNDRQWYAVDGDPTNGGNLYLTYNRAAQNSPLCPAGQYINSSLVMARSPLPAAGATAGVVFAPSKDITAPCDEGIMGNNEVSPTSHHIFIIHDTDQYDAVRMARCVAVDFTVDPTGLQCSDHLITAYTGFVVAANTPWMAIDGNGKLYAIWEKAPCSPCAYGPQNVPAATITGDTSLWMSTSTNEGNTWSSPTQVPTTGLKNSVYASMAAGDGGRLDLAYYGTATGAACVPADPATCKGPDSVNGDWGVYFQQSLDGGAHWTPPIQASETFVHRGTIFTNIGAQSGSRSLGDFLELRIGLQGEANIAYGNSANIVGGLTQSQAMFVRQVGGSTVKAQKPNICGVAPQTNRVFDPRGDATLDAATQVGANQPNLDILASDITQPDAQHYQVRMVVDNLVTLAPTNPAAGTVQVWSTQWHVPSSTDPNGGKIFHAYMESDNGAAPTFWDGENALFLANGGNGSMSYPGTHLITGTYTAGSPGVITISVPVADVTVAGATSTTLFSVTTSSQALPTVAENANIGSGIGGVPFNLIDVVEPYDFIPGASAARGDTCGTTPSPSPRPSASPGGGGGGHESQDEDNDDDDRGVNDTEYELGLPTSILNLVDPPDVPSTNVSPLPSAPTLP
ncbi:MAG: hypothetical protein QOK05_2860 [Chloroflexota bacterium]|jgi:hypothetical protein|nr:hypothetical protein [Chloroflexota bacterium]